MKGKGFFSPCLFFPFFFFLFFAPLAYLFWQIWKIQNDKRQKRETAIMLGYNIGDVHHLQCTLVVWIACFVILLYSVIDALIHLLKHSSAESAILCALAKAACVSIRVQSQGLKCITLIQLKTGHKGRLALL